MSYPNADAVSPGECVLHYQVQQRLGAGGMGVVYKALDTKLKRHVALKFLPPDLGSDPSYRERLLHEAMAASAIDHPNMGAVYSIEDLGEGRQFIVMAYYDGETLRARLDRGRLSSGEVIDITLQVARGLSKAHERGIIHRDIKPSNLILTSEGVVKIVDFGLARIASEDSLTKTGTTVGTAAYMSPEQATHSAMDHRTDLWSLGVVMHEMLRGDTPFHGDSALALLYAVVHYAPDPLTGVLPALAAIVDRCLKKPAQERYASARDLIDQLERVRAGMDSAATETVAMSIPEQSSRRIPIVITVIALVLVVGASLMWWKILRAPVPSPIKVAAVLPSPPPPPPPTKIEPVVPEKPVAVSSPVVTPVAKVDPPVPVVKLPPLRRALSPSEYGGPLRGELQWSGKLANRETLTIQAGHAASGSLSDDLPLVPITIEIARPGLDIVEAPSPRNQWDRLVLRNVSGGMVTGVTVRWKVVR